MSNGTVYKRETPSASDLDSVYAELLRGGGVNGRRLSLTSVHHVHAALNKMLHDAERKGVVIRNVARLANAPSRLPPPGRKARR